MSERKSGRKQIPGDTMCFSYQEIKILIEVFGCKTVGELSRAAQRYENLFFMFDPASISLGGACDLQGMRRRCGQVAVLRARTVVAVDSDGDLTSV